MPQRDPIYDTPDDPWDRGSPPIIVREACCHGSVNPDQTFEDISTNQAFPQTIAFFKENMEFYFHSPPACRSINAGFLNYCRHRAINMSATVREEFLVVILTALNDAPTPDGLIPLPPEFSLWILLDFINLLPMPVC
jgi:hypothetical protein